MFVDCRELESGSVVQADVCIVGSGFAGISLALGLKGSGLKVALLESGGFETEQEHKQLLDGTFDGPHPNKAYLRTSRSRIFGGTSDKWTGTCRPLDEIDYEARDWVPDSGWPFDEKELEPYYRRAAPLLKIRQFEVFDQDGALITSNRLAGPDFTRFVPKALFHSHPRARFGDLYRTDLQTSEDIVVYLHANVLELSAHQNGAAIEEALVGNFAGRDIRFRARDFVLAAGAFDCARIMLVSNRVHRSGLANENDLLGRYFMDHTRMPRIAQLVPTHSKMRPWESTGAAGVKYYSYSVFSPTREVQRSLEMLNCGVRLSELDKEEVEAKTGPFAREVGGLARGFDQTLPGGAKPARRARPLYSAKLYNEHVPLHHSRVRLGADQDPLGQPRLVVEWRSNAQMDQSIERTLELLAMEFGRLARGRLHLSPAEPAYTKPCYLGAHPMGITRMHVDPRKGVVDPDCKAHGLANLFVASSSVFPTGGFVNPTFTIVALALRLADFLKRKHERY